MALPNVSQVSTNMTAALKGRGFRVQSAVWASGQTTRRDTLVKHNGKIWLALVTNTVEPSDANSTQWMLWSDSPLASYFEERIGPVGFIIGLRTGTTAANDNYALVQAKINEAPNRRYRFPAGTYYFSAGLRYDQPGVTIEGVNGSFDGTRLLFGHTSGSSVFLNARSCGLVGICIDATDDRFNASGQLRSGHGVYVGHLDAGVAPSRSSVILNDVNVRRQPGACYYFAATIQRSRFVNLIAESSHGPPIVFDDGAYGQLGNRSNGLGIVEFYTFTAYNCGGTAMFGHPDMSSGLIGYRIVATQFEIVSCAFKLGTDACPFGDFQMALHNMSTVDMFNLGLDDSQFDQTTRGGFGMTAASKATPGYGLYALVQHGLLTTFRSINVAGNVIKSGTRALLIEQPAIVNTVAGFTMPFAFEVEAGTEGVYIRAGTQTAATILVLARDGAPRWNYQGKDFRPIPGFDGAAGGYGFVEDDDFILTRPVSAGEVIVYSRVTEVAPAVAADLTHVYVPQNAGGKTIPPKGWVCEIMNTGSANLNIKDTGNIAAPITLTPNAQIKLRSNGVKMMLAA